MSLTKMATTKSHGGVVYYVVREEYHQNDGMENGWDNPFRPGGNLSKEADEIVELIKGGKPITPTSGTTPTLVDESDEKFTNRAHAPITESPKKATATSLNATPQSANGNVKNEKLTSPGSLDVQRGSVMPAGMHLKLSMSLSKRNQSASVV